MNEEIKQIQRKILGIRQVFNTHHNPVLHKNDEDTLFAEIDRLQAQLDDITWKAKDVDADEEEEDELKRIRQILREKPSRFHINDLEGDFLLSLVDNLIKKNINMWDSSIKTVMECHNLRTERDRLKTELETQRQFSKEMVVELGKVQAENNNYKSMYVYPAIPTSGNATVPSVWHDASSFRPSDFDASYAHPDKRQEAEKRSLWKSDETEQTKATWEKFNISKTDFLPQETQETFISPIVSLDLDKVTTKQDGGTEVDLP